MRKDSMNKMGFTLVELLIVIAIFSTVTSITVPNVLAWIPEYRLKSAVRELEGNMQLARMKAIRSSDNCRVTFDSSAQQYTITIMSSSPETVKTVDLSTYKSGVIFRHPSGGTAIPSAGITFTPQGLVTNISDAPCLTNEGRTEFYRIRALLSGIIQTQTWNGNDWE